MFASSLTLAAALASPVPGNATELPLVAARIVQPAATSAVEGAAVEARRLPVPPVTTAVVEGTAAAVEARQLQNLPPLLLL